ncbi:MAG TPA: sialidase family protein [Candidatus Limnocylindrales bacterium]
MKRDNGVSGERQAEAERRLRQMFSEAPTPRAPEEARDLLRSIAAGERTPLRPVIRTRFPFWPGGRPGKAFSAMAIVALALAVVFAAVGVFLPRQAPPAYQPAYQSSSPSPQATASSSIPTKPPPPPTAVPSPTETPIAGNVTGGLTWTRVSTPDGLLFGPVISDDGGFLAVGTPADGFPPSFWRSTDGLTWSEQPAAPAFVDADPNKYFYGVSNVARAPGTTHMVAVGARYLMDDTNDGDAAAWYSADGGQTWTRSAESPGFANAVISDVIAGPNGWIAVGLDGYPQGGTQGIGVKGAAVWTSTDGLHWKREATQASFAGAGMGQILQNGHGFIASGSDYPTATTAAEPAIWTSPDGKIWTRVSANQGFGESAAAGVNAVPDGFVATVTAWGGPSAMWFSQDGATWKPAEPLLDGSSKACGGGVIHLPTIDLAIGNDCGSTSLTTVKVILWTSTDGRQTWQRAPSLSMFENADFGSFASNSQRLVIVGETYQPSDTIRHGFVWVAVPASP